MYVYQTLAGGSFAVKFVGTHLLIFVTTVVVSLLTREEEREKLMRFFRLAGPPVLGRSSFQAADAERPGEARHEASGEERRVREIRVGLAGLGKFGKLHADVLGPLPGAVLAAVCDPREPEVAAVADRYGVGGRFGEYERMLEEAELDCVSIATPEPLHADMAVAALERGLAVFLEKPLATTHSEGERVADAAERAKAFLQVGMILRFDVQHAYLKREIDAGRFGRLVSLRVKRNATKAWFAKYGDRVNPVYETVIHDIDLVLWYTRSRCERVHAVARSLSGLRHPDAYFALLELEDGSVAQVETSWFVPQGAPANVLTEEWHGTIDAALEITGTERTARFDLLASGLAVWTPQLTAQPEAAYWPELHGRTTGALREELEHFVECVRAGRPSDVASVVDAVEGLRIADAIVAAAESGREVSLARS